MSRVSRVVGGLAGAVIALSALPHGWLGWPEMARQLAAAGAPAALQQGLRVGWLFGSVSMLVFGVAAVHAAATAGGRALGGFTVGTIAAAYTAFGVWAYAGSGDPFFAVFIGPGVLLLVAWALSRARH